MTPAPLFVTGTARSGSTLLAYLLSAHPRVRVASDPCFPLLRALRDAMIIAAAPAGSPLRAFLDQPLQDGYFTDERVALLDLILAGSVDVECPPARRTALLPALVERARHESADLAPHLARLSGRTYRELFAEVLAAVGRTRGGGDARYVGLKEVWMIDFVPALARAFPDARFVVLMRDPRATIASLRALGERDPSQRAHAVSYLRHWRKQVALVTHFRSDPALEGRVHVVEYEALLAEGQAAVDGLCRFLELEPHADMLDPKRYRDAAGQAWSGNSSFDGARPSWTSTLAAAVVEMADFILGPEMALTSYAPVSAPVSAGRLLEGFAAAEVEGASWRSDLGDPQADVGFELFRRALLEAPAGAAPPALVRRGFLFEDVFQRVRERRPS
jgi:sulfotransferase family protein